MNRKYKNLSARLIPLEDGENPPAHKINPDYHQQPSNPRKCPQCGKIHDTIVEDKQTGERLSEIEKCYDCFIESAFII